MLILDTGQAGQSSRYFKTAAQDVSTTIEVNPYQIEFRSSLGEATREQAKLMGFRVGSGGWKLGGVLREFFYGMRGSGFVVNVYGYVTVDVEVTGPDGEQYRTSMRLVSNGPNYVPRAFEMVVRRMLVQGAHDILARLNAKHFEAQPDPAVAKIIAEIDATGAQDQENRLDALSLSGSAEAAAFLVELLEKTTEADNRADIINALARLAPTEMLSVLKQRYAGESKDGRWFTLKALGYLGTPEATAALAELESSEKFKPVRDLAEYLGGTP